MENWKLKETKIRLEYVVVEKGSPDQPYEEAIELPIGQIGTIPEPEQTDDEFELPASTLLGLEVNNEEGQVRYVLYRRQGAFKFDFDENESVLPLYGALKIVLALQGKLGEDFTDTAYYPINPENDLLVTAEDISQLSKDKFKFIVTESGDDSDTPLIAYKLCVQAGPPEDKCSSCYHDPPRSKRIQCALDGCYS